MVGFECGLRPIGAYAPVGSGTRRRPIGRDYAAAKDAECGIIDFGLSRYRILDCGLFRFWICDIGFRIDNRNLIDFTF